MIAPPTLVICSLHNQTLKPLFGICFQVISSPHHVRNGDHMSSPTSPPPGIPATSSSNGFVCVPPHTMTD